MGSIVVFVHLLAAGIWMGGFVAIAIVVRIAGGELDTLTRIAFFRRLGRSYLGVGGGSLAVALGTGSVLLTRGGWTAARTVAVVLGIALAITSVAGVLQARAMTRLRARAAHGPDGAAAETVRSAAVRAALLRGAIGVLTLALLAVGSSIAA